MAGMANATVSYDVLVVGSGINSLVCAALLVRAGRRVHVLEREAVLGGCIRTEALTLPGFAHDTLSTAHPLFMVGPAYAALGSALHAAGLEYCRNDTPTGVLMPDGRHLVLATSRDENLRRMEASQPGAAAAYAAAMADVEANAELIFALLGQELWRWPTGKLLARQAWRQGVQPLAGFFGAALEPARAWLVRAFGDVNSPAAALLAPQMPTPSMASKWSMPVNGCARPARKPALSPWPGCAMAGKASRHSAATAAVCCISLALIAAPCPVDRANLARG